MVGRRGEGVGGWQTVRIYVASDGLDCSNGWHQGVLCVSAEKIPLASSHSPEPKARHAGMRDLFSHPSPPKLSPALLSPPASFIIYNQYF